MDSTEVRAVSATGGEKGTKLARFDLIPADVMWELAEHFGKGSMKYDDNNWQKGYDWGHSIAALERHLNLFKQGVDYDDDPSLPGEPSRHIVAALWHCMALAWFQLHRKEFDNRSVHPVDGQAVDMVDVLGPTQRGSTWAVMGSNGVCRFYRWIYDAWWVKGRSGFPWAASLYGSDDIPASEGPFTLIGADDEVGNEILGSYSWACSSL